MLFFLFVPHLTNCRRKQLSRQQSLRDTKLLLTTHLKRTASIFMFDKHFEYLREIGHGSFSTVGEFLACFGSCHTFGGIFLKFGNDLSLVFDYAVPMARRLSE